MHDVHVAVISAHRAENVPSMEAHVRAGLPAPTWYVPAGQGAAYVAAGAELVVEVDGRLVEQRNAALAAAHGDGLPCLQLDDDYRRCKVIDVIGEPARPSGLAEAAAVLAAALADTGARLAGGSSTGNAYFTRRPISTAHFVIAQMILVAPSEPRFDPGFRVKEDYDFTAQHLAAYGVVARVDRLLPTFVHYSNAGGCQTYRSPDVEAAACARLAEKWPGVFRANPRRENEVLMRWRGRRAA